MAQITTALTTAETRAANENYDPHNLKHQGVDSAKHAFKGEEYEYQEYPRILYKDGKTAIVHSDEELTKAKGDGFVLESPVGGGGPDLVRIEPQHIVIDEPADTTEDGKDGKIVYKSSGDDTDAGDWTKVGRDAEGYPVPKGSTSDITAADPQVPGTTESTYEPNSTVETLPSAGRANDANTEHKPAFNED